MKLRGWSQDSPKQIQDGGGRHLKFRKRSITLDWIKTSALNFIGKMHHGHAEMTT